MVRALGVIPARFASTRFRGKPLALLAGRPVIRHVWERAAACERFERVVVATDDDRIERACLDFGAECVRTSAEHPSGTDRVAEAFEVVSRRTRVTFDLVVNVQGDEPLVSPTALRTLVAVFDETPTPDVATLHEPFRTVDDVLDPNCVKVVADGRGRALYFSRAPIPFPKGTPSLAALRAALDEGRVELGTFRKHQGIYAYRPEALARWTSLRRSPLESSEGLEQLRALEHGLSIRVVPSDFESIGVDTPADLARVEAKLNVNDPPTPGARGAQETTR